MLIAVRRLRGFIWTVLQYRGEEAVLTIGQPESIFLGDPRAFAPSADKTS
jgi:hypothetical protein